MEVDELDIFINFVDELEFVVDNVEGEVGNVGVNGGGYVGVFL